MGVTEAGGAFRPLRHYETPFHLAGAGRRRPAPKEYEIPEAAIHAQTNVGRARAAATNNGSGYAVYDPVGQKIGIVERVFANSDDEPVYIRVRIGLFGTKTVLIPVQFVETDEVRITLVTK